MRISDIFGNNTWAFVLDAFIIVADCSRVTAATSFTSPLFGLSLYRDESEQRFTSKSRSIAKKR